MSGSAAPAAAAKICLQTVKSVLYLLRLVPGLLGFLLPKVTGRYRAVGVHTSDAAVLQSEAFLLLLISTVKHSCCCWAVKMSARFCYYLPYHRQSRCLRVVGIIKGKPSTQQLISHHTSSPHVTGRLSSRR